MLADWGDAERRLSDRVSVLVGSEAGAYPSGNSVLVRVTSETFLIDPSVDVVSRSVIEGRPDFLVMVDRFASVIDRRHSAMLEFLAKPRSLDEMVVHRIVYRPDVEMPMVEPVERRTAELQLSRMLARGEATELEPGRYCAT
jgi:hypothetical protein